MAGTIVVDRIESDASYASTINVAGQITFSNTVNFGAFAGTAPVAGFYLPTTNNLAFTTASTERMRIDSAGNVGIGTTSPSAVLGVNGDIKFGSNSSGTYPGGRFYTNAGTVFIEQLNTQSMQFKTNSAEFIWSQGANERMRIDSSGNVGIGTNSPTTYKSAKLAIRNSASSGEAVLAIINNSSTVYEGAGILLGSTAASTNYGATWLYHTYNTNSPTNTTSYAFNISQRATDGTYVSNIWNVDYQNSVTTWYRPNTSVLQMQLDASNNLLFNSGYGSAATAYGCRAWCKFNGTGTIAINGSGNVSSLTDNGVGDYSVNFTNAMPDANFSGVGTATYIAGGVLRYRTLSGYGWSTGSYRVITGYNDTVGADHDTVCVAVFR